MNEKYRAELFRLRPDRMEFRIGEFHASNGVANGGAAQALAFDRSFKLLHGKLGRLQCQRGKRRKTIGMRSAELGELLILKLDDLPGEVSILAIPERID